MVHAYGRLENQSRDCDTRRLMAEEEELGGKEGKEVKVLPNERLQLDRLHSPSGAIILDSYA
jgi:hypothetical protein